MVDADKGLSHRIIQSIKEIAVEIGHTPTRNEYRAHALGCGDRKLLKAFGGYAAAVMASGLEQTGHGPGSAKLRKVTAEALFSRPVPQPVSSADNQRKPNKVVVSDHFKSTLCIGDSHYPFVHYDTLCLIYEFADRYKPERIIQVGDLYDMFSQSRFPRSMNIYNPHEEMSVGKKMAAEMWETLRRMSPSAECYQLLGNHDVRPLKNILAKAPELEVFMDIKPFFTFDGVDTSFDIRQELNLDGVLFHHGHYSKLGDHMKYNGASTVVGHSHRGGVHCQNFNEEIRWELNCGYIGDPTTKALGYTPQRITHWTHGFGFIDALGPRFIPA